MTVYKYFLRLAWRQKYVILLYLLLFVVISILNSSASRPADASFSESLPDVAIIQQDSGPLAQGLADYLRSQSRPAGRFITEANAEEAIFMGAAENVVIIPETFTADFNEGLPALAVYTDDRQPSAALMSRQIDQYLMFLKADARTHGEADPARVAQAMAVKAEVRLAESPGGVVPGTAGWFRYYFNFMTYILIAIFIMVFGNIMTEFNNEHIKRRNAIIPVSSSRFQMDMILAQLVIAFGIAALFLLIGVLIRPGEVGGLNWPGHILNAASFTLAALALAFLINSLTRNRFIHTALATALSLGVSFISGVMIPLEFLSPGVITLARFFPVYYYVQATDKILQGTAYAADLGIQLLFALLFLVLGLTAIRIRQGEDLISNRLRPQLSTDPRS